MKDSACPAGPSAGSRRAVPVLALALLTGCAGATFQSGVGDRFLERPPFYAGSAGPVAGRILHLPVAYQWGATQAPVFEPAGSRVAGLLNEMNAVLDSLGASTRSPGLPPAGTPPDVQLGCETDAAGDCPEFEEAPAESRRLRLAVGRPSADWTAAMGETMGREGANVVLVITLEVGQDYTRQKNFRGDKEIELGTGHAMSFPWLTSLETPVSVLQLTGALLDRDGRAMRIGAEGILARRTSLPVSSVGGQALIGDEEVEQARTARREDLPGRPLVWQAALRTLVRGLLERR